MYSQNRYEKSSLINDITCMMQNEFHNEEIKIQMIDPLITHVILRLQPWIATLMIIFGIYFIMIIAILILIIRNDIKR